MPDWEEALAHAVGDVEHQFDKLKYRLHYALGGPGPIKIVPYRGFGNRNHLFLRGRVLEDKGDLIAKDNDTIWRNLVNAYLRAESDEIPNARLVARFEHYEFEIVADEEGMFDVAIETAAPLPDDRLWFSIDLELKSPHSPKQTGPVRATGECLVPTRQARYVVVSDIDDTVIDAGMAHLLHVARTVFLGNARTRIAFPGVPAFYRALHAGFDGRAQNPLFYVSSEPWNLYDLLAQFFNLHDIPIGPVLFLRNWGIGDSDSLPLHHRDFKLGVIRHMLAVYPELPFIFIGDNGQEDPEIYRDVADDYPGRIAAIYIREVNSERRRRAEVHEVAEQVGSAGVAMIVAANTGDMARDAADRGFIAAELVAEVSAAD